MGGGLAAVAAGSHPQQVASAFLMDPVDWSFGSDRVDSQYLTGWPMPLPPQPPPPRPPPTPTLIIKRNKSTQPIIQKVYMLYDPEHHTRPSPPLPPDPSLCLLAKHYRLFLSVVPRPPASSLPHPIQPGTVMLTPRMPPDVDHCTNCAPCLPVDLPLAPSLTCPGLGPALALP